MSMDTSTLLALASILITIIAQFVVMAWKVGSIVHAVDERISAIDKKLSIEIVEIKVRLADLLKHMRN